MKKLTSIVILLAILLSFASCKPKNNSDEDVIPPQNQGDDTPGDEPGGDPVTDLVPAMINGVSISEFVIVYDAEGLDYNKRAAEYIKAEIMKRSGTELDLVDDSAEQSSHEIVVGETSRAISAELDEECDGLEFSMLVKDGSIAIEGDYFIIAAAAYFLIDTYGFESGDEKNIPEGVTVHEPIIKEAKNFIVLIGDGMGVNQTLLFDHLTDTTDFSDKEDFFYGYLFPSQGFSRTDSLSGTTDSAAGGTAIACGTKTYNEYVGRNKDGENILSLTELAASLGKATAVMSTEAKTGATPAAFSSHAYDRDSTTEIVEGQVALYLQYGTVIDCGYDYYDANNINKIVEKHITDTLNKMSKDEDGFFLMYEEAYIDKHNHNNEMDKAFRAVLRFNQAIARFMEYAFYNPETFVLITADHESGGLIPDDNGNLHYTTEDHTSANVPIFAYGYGSELFNGKTVENIQIGHTIASFLGVYDFGDQSEFSYLK